MTASPPAVFAAARLRLALAVSAMAVAGVSCGGGSQSAGKSTKPAEASLLPVRVSSAELGIGRPDQAPAELARPFETPLTIGRKNERATAVDCASALDLQRQGYAALYPRDQAALGVLTARCLALDALKNAQPARLSYLPPPPFTGSLVEMLPAALAPAVKPEQQQAVERATRERLPLRKVEVTLAFEGARDDEVHLAGEGWQQVVTILARADFDGDGRQDWLVRADLALEGSTNRSSRAFLLTRHAPDALIHAMVELKP